MSISILERLRARQAVIGGMVSLTSPALVEAMGYAGLDFVIIDTEHGPADTESVESLFRAAKAGGTVPFVRVPAAQRDLISRVMDSGAAGVMIPQINSLADLDLAVGAMRFPPQGVRGLAPTVRAARYGFLPLEEFLTWTNNEALLIAQIESREAMTNLPGLLRTGKIDIVFIGPMDLSQSLGVPGLVSHDSVQNAIEDILRTCLECNVPVGSVARDASGVAEWVRRGCSFVALTSTLPYRVYRDRIDQARLLVGEAA
jgi:4-hydroxy-2-oxoheptanedioate aldolase